MPTDTVTLLGAGRMGSAFVERWSAAGRAVSVWNRTPPAAEALRSENVHPVLAIDEAVAGAAVVVTMLMDGAALRSVLVDQGALDAMAAGTVLVDLSTVDVDSSATVARAAAERGIPFVRGAVSGTPAVVRSGAAALLLSGSPGAIVSAQPVLADIATSLTVVGAADEARVVKLAINAMLAGTTQLLSEATVLAEASGIDRATFLDAVDASVLGSRFIGYKGMALRARDYAPTFTTDGLHKDVTLALSQADTVGVPMPSVEVALDRLAVTRAEGYGDDDFLSLFRTEQRAADQAVDTSP